MTVRPVLPRVDLRRRAGMLRRLRNAPERVANAARLAGATQVEPGSWTAQQMVLHLVAVEAAVFQGRLRDLAERTNPHWSWVEPGPAPAAPDETIGQSSDRFRAARAATLDTVGRLDPAGWERAGVHATVGRLDVTGLLALAADHDADHLRALNRLARRTR